MTFCFQIQKELAVSTCPLSEGGCYFRHKITGNCCYDVLKNVDPTEVPVQFLAQALGHEEPTEEQIDLMVTRIRTRVMNSR